MPGELKDLIEKVVTSDPVARKVARAQKLDTRLGALALTAGNASTSASQAYAGLGGVGGIDDGNPPADPSSIVVAPGIASLEIRWTPPARGDGVVLTRVRKTRSNDGNIATKTVRQSAFTWVNVTTYSPDTHLIEVQHEDAWGRVSAWVNAGSFSPLKASDFDIASVSAAKITAGTIAAQTITLGTGGTLSGGGGRFDDNGFSLANAFGAVTGAMRPSNTSADWFTGPFGMNMGGSGAGAQQRYAGLAFFSYTTASPRRGAILQADGVKSTLPAEDLKGQVIIRATDGQNLTPGTAQETAEIILDAGNSPGNPGTIIMDGILNIEHDLIMSASTWVSTKDLTVNGFFTAAGGVDFTAASSANFGNVRISGGYSTGTFNLNTGRWSYSNGVLPTIELRRSGAFVSMSGRCQNSAGGVNGSGLRIGWITADYRPATAKFITIPRQTMSVYDGNTRITIQPDGDIFLCATSANEISAGQDISFDGVGYSVF